jgi:hypothetical protein
MGPRSRESVWNRRALAPKGSSARWAPAQPAPIRPEGLIEIVLIGGVKVRFT